MNRALAATEALRIANCWCRMSPATEMHPEGTLTWHPYVMPTCDIGTRQLSTLSKPICQAAIVEMKDSPFRGLYPDEVD